MEWRNTPPARVGPALPLYSEDFPGDGVDGFGYIRFAVQLLPVTYMSFERILASPELARSSPFHHRDTRTPFVMDVENKAASDEAKDSRSTITVESYLDAGDRDKVQRKLQQRHIQMCVIPPAPFASSF